jgi:glycosyltransferase involved in cell wall biosynthesis
LLFLLPFPPRKDAHGGGMRITGELVHRLAARHDVAVLALRGPCDSSAADALESLAVHVEEIAHESRRPSRVHLLTGTPSWVVSLHVPEFERRVQALAASWRPDIVQIEYPVMAQYLSALKESRAPRVLVEHDPAVPAARERSRSKAGPARLEAVAGVLAWRRFERRAVRAVQAVVVFTAEDARALQEIVTDTPVVVIPFGVATPNGPLNPTGEDGEVLFIGSFVHAPNVDAAVRLARTIMPRILEVRPEARLTLVGARPSVEVHALAGPRVSVHADVPDVRPFLERAAVVVAPLRLGGGMRVKVLEALAAGKAVVASSLAVRGLGVVSGRHLFVADREFEFADAVAALLADSRLRAELGAAAHAWARTELSWDRSVSAFESLYVSLLERAATRRS